VARHAAVENERELSPAGRRAAPADGADPMSRAGVRNMVLAMIALTMFVVAMIASYAGAFAKPTLHHLSVAVAGPEQVVDAIKGQDTLAVTTVGDDAAARRQVYERKTDAAFVVAPGAEMKIYVAGGAGRSVATAAESVGRAIAAKAGFVPTVTDVAPASAGNPSGTVEFYAVIFISIGASVGATVFGRIMGTVRKPATFLLRTLTLAAYSALLAGVVTAYTDAVLGALPGHGWQVFGALWLYAMAVGGAITGVASAFGTIASMGLTLFLVIVGNAAAAGPVGRPLLSGFYSTFSSIVPQGSGVSLLRSVEYFGANGSVTPVVTLMIWGAAGCLLALGATVPGVVRFPRTAPLNYRAGHDGNDADPARRERTILRPGVPSPAD
jgi:hypothetical protein